MHRLIGFALFCFAIGMGVALLIKTTFLTVGIIVVCLVVGYNLFFCR